MAGSGELWLWVPGVIVLAALITHAWFSRLHTALIQARRVRLAQLGEQRPAVLAAAEALLDSPGDFEVAAHLTTTVCEAITYAGAGALALAAAANARPGVTFGQLLPVAVPTLITALIGAVLAVLLLGEALPKTLASRRPEAILLKQAGFMRTWSAVLSPVMAAVRWFGRLTARILGISLDQGTRAARSEEEIKIIVGGSADEGVIELEEKEMIDSIFDFTETAARQIMVPRVDVDAIEAEATLEDAVALIVETGHTRLPVYETTLDKVAGVVYAKDLLRELLQGNAQRTVRELAREPFFVPEGKKLDELLAAFRQHRTQMAIVVDEFGGTAGLVTLEDVIEEIVGEIQDEYDVEEPAIQPAGDETWVVDAHLPLDEVNEELKLALPPGDYDTLGGFVYNLFGRPPAVGEQAEFEGVAFVIEATEGARILTIRLIRTGLPLPPADEASGNGTAPVETGP